MWECAVEGAGEGAEEPTDGDCAAAAAAAAAVAEEAEAEAEGDAGHEEPYRSRRPRPCRGSLYTGSRAAPMLPGEAKPTPVKAAPCTSSNRLRVGCAGADFTAGRAGPGFRGDDIEKSD